MIEWRESEQPWGVGGYEFESEVTCQCANEFVTIEPADGAEATCERCGRRYRLKISVEEADALPDWKAAPPREPDGTLTRAHVLEAVAYLAAPTLTFGLFTEGVQYISTEQGEEQQP